MPWEWSRATVFGMTVRPWKTLASEVLLERKWLRIRQERIETGRGAIIDEFHVIEGPPWAAIVCVTTRRELVLVEQYRHGHGELSLELPAGVIEKAEDPLVAAQRELLEETGYGGGAWQALCVVRPEPARHTQWAHLFVCVGAELLRPQALDDTEDVRVVLRPVAELDAVVDEVIHGVHVGALLLAERRGYLK